MQQAPQGGQHRVRGLQDLAAQASALLQERRWCWTSQGELDLLTEEELSWGRKRAEARARDSGGHAGPEGRSGKQVRPLRAGLGAWAQPEAGRAAGLPQTLSLEGVLVCLPHSLSGGSPEGGRQAPGEGAAHWSWGKASGSFAFPGSKELPALMAEALLGLEGWDQDPRARARGNKHG